MSEALILSPTTDRATRYAELWPQLRAVLEAETDLVANMANFSAILAEGLRFFWVGFYRRIGDELVLGPFQGPLACTRITLDRGVCGAAARRQQTLIVPDVHQFPGHIACSAAAKSEIVVPGVREGRTEFVLDIDSKHPDDFSELDQRYLEEAVAWLVQFSLR